MLDTIGVVGGALILALFSSALILPSSNDPARPPMQSQPNGKAASKEAGGDAGFLVSEKNCLRLE